jgi:hypothetical protein
MDSVKDLVITLNTERNLAVVGVVHPIKMGHLF